MPWFKVDDQLHKHRKSRIAGAPAMGLWVLAGSWCAAELNDGFVPASVCAQWASNYKRLAGLLVTAGLWSEWEKAGEKGWQFHDWHDFQPTAAKVRKERAEAQERMRRLRAVND